MPEEPEEPCHLCAGTKEVSGIVCPLCRPLTDEDPFRNMFWVMENNLPRPAKTLNEAFAFVETGGFILKKETVGTYEISTVFLRHGPRFDRYWFETMVSPQFRAEVFSFYKTFEEAKQGHEQIAAVLLRHITG